MRILFDTIAAGGGHVATARAMADAVLRVGGGAHELEVRDAMDALGLVRHDRAHKRAWALLLRVPPLVRVGQRAMDALPRAQVLLQRASMAATARRAVEDLRRRPADLVVVNHGWLMTAYALARTRHGLRVPVVTFATEPFDASALWAEPEAQRVVAPSAAARSCLIRLGVPEGRVDQLGYPVAGPFLSPPTREAARERVGLPDGRWALLSLGGEGVAPGAAERVAALRASGLGVWVVTGRNRDLRDRLGHRFDGDARVRVEGFTDRMAERIALADVVVGKAGPASVMEALAVGRPFVVASLAGLNELEVARFLEDRGLGGRPRVLGRGSGADAVARAARDAAAGAGRFAGVRERLARLPFQAMSDDLGRHLLACAEGRAAPPPVVRDRAGWDDVPAHDSATGGAGVGW